MVFRYTLPFTVIGEGGYPRSRIVPCLVISAGAAFTFLADCAASATPIPGLGEDLRFLAHAVAGVTRWVEAGRVTPRLYRHGPTWYAHWQLLGGGAQRVWLTELLHTLPPVLAHNGGFSAVESFVDAMTAELCVAVGCFCSGLQSDGDVSWHFDREWPGNILGVGTGEQAAVTQYVTSGVGRYGDGSGAYRENALEALNIGL